MNLTAIRDPLAMVRYHIADSLALARAVELFPVNGSLAKAGDIGTGAGFPLLPMAIIWPNVFWIGIESVKKKAEFVRQTIASLELENCSIIRERAETVGRSDLRGTLDLVTYRAVGSISSLIEIGLPLLRVGGQLYLFKTASSQTEWDACLKTIRDLGGNETGQYDYELAGDEQSRRIFVVTKASETPDAYPRLSGIPFKKPLVKPATL